MGTRNKAILRILAASLLVVSMIPSLAPPSRADVPAPQSTAVSLFRDDIVGFGVKRPAGWLIRYTTGVIAILKDEQAREGVLIYPVRPKAGFTLQDFLSSYLAVLKRSSSGSSRIDFANLTGDRQKASAEVSGFIAGTAISGRAEGFILPPDFVLTVIWAPAGEFAAKRAALRTIAASYERRPGTVLVRLRGEYFESVAPKGWKIGEESSTAITFANAALDASVLVSYGDFGGDSAPMTIPRLFEALTKPCSPGQQPCFSITKSYTRLAANESPDFRDAMGRTWKARAEEFDATLIDAAASRVHGVLTGMVMCGRHVTGLYGWIFVTATRIARPDRWESNSAATSIIQENLKIIKASELITRRILPRNNPYDSSTIMGHWAYKNSVDDALSAKCRESIMGYETYHTPTGDRVDVPLNSIPGGSNSLSYNPQTGLLWGSTLEPPPRDYVVLQR
jgi:hypothetical protein